jgi:hypothetical protein
MIPDALERPMRRWCQFSLKGLLVLVSVACVLLGTVGVKMNRKRHEREVVAEIERLGGWVLFDWQRDDDETEPPGPSWIRRLVGDDFFSRVYSVMLIGPQYVPDPNVQTEQPATADCLRSVSGAFPTLEELDICTAQVDDANLDDIKRMNGLKRLDIRRTRITDDGIAELRKALPNCEIRR